MKKLNKILVSKLACPYDHQPVVLRRNSYFKCKKCKRHYLIRERGIPDFLPDNLRSQGDDDFGGSVRKKSIEWQPGLRYWNPGFLANILRIGQGTGRLLDKKSGETMLDVGCGGNAQGDVNADIYIPDPIPENFVLASAELLPFRDNSFDVVRSAYVIEHNLFPTEMIKEHFRVCKKTVKTYTDNSDWMGAVILRILNTGFIFHDEHYFKWSKEYFTNILNRLGLRGKVVTFNTSPSYLVKAVSLLGVLPRIGVIFHRDLYVEIYKK